MEKWSVSGKSRKNEAKGKTRPPRNARAKFARKGWPLRSNGRIEKASLRGGDEQGFAFLCVLEGFLSFAQVLITIGQCEIECAVCGRGTDCILKKGRGFGRIVHLQEALGNLGDCDCIRVVCDASVVVETDDRSKRVQAVIFFDQMGTSYVVLMILGQGRTKPEPRLLAVILRKEAEGALLVQNAFC